MRTKKIIIILFCIVLLLSAFVFVPTFSITEKSKKFNGKIYSKKEIDKFWKQWAQDCNNSSKLKNETNEIPYLKYANTNNKNQELNQYLWWENSSFDKNKNKIYDSIDTKSSLKSNITINIIVHYNHHPNSNDIKTLKEKNLTITYIAKYTNIIIIDNCTFNEITKISKLNNVIMIEEQQIFKSCLNVATRALKARESAVYDPYTVWGSGSQNWATGDGVNIAIIDTGADDADHESLEDKFIAGFDATIFEDEGDNGIDDSCEDGSGCDDPDDEPADGSTNPDDDNGHGTHCAGIALGDGGSSGTYKGVAPDANLIDVKVLDSEGSGSSADIIEGIEWCIDNRNTDWSGTSDDGIDILSMSFGNVMSDGQDAISLTANQAVQNGLVCIAAVGNQYSVALIGAPAAGDLVIAVAAADDLDTIDRSDDILSQFSSKGPRTSDNDGYYEDELKPDVTAPGEDILAPEYDTEDEYIEHSGTSMSTPAVAGVAALMREVYPNLCPDQIKSILRKTAEQRGLVYDSALSNKYNIRWGFGYCDAYKAVKSAVGGKSTNSGDGVTAYIDPSEYSVNSILNSDIPQDSEVYGFAKSYKIASGSVHPGGPAVFPEDCPTASLPSHASYIFSADDYEENWDEEGANVEFKPVSGNFVGMTTRIGIDSFEGIGMAEPLLNNIDTDLYSPFLLNVDDFESMIVLQNPTYDLVDATVKFYYSDGSLAETEYISDMPSKSALKLESCNYLGEDSGNAEIIITDGDGLLGHVERINTLTESGMSDQLFTNIETVLYYFPIGTGSMNEYFILNNPTDSSVEATIYYYTQNGYYSGSDNIQLSAHSTVQIDPYGMNAKISVTGESGGLIGIAIAEDSEFGTILSAQLTSSSDEILISPYLEENGNWDSYIILHNPENTAVDIEISFYNLDGTLACEDEIENIAAHSTIIIYGEDYVDDWDESSANAVIEITDGPGLIGCISHEEPIYYIGFSTNLFSSSLS